MRRLLVQASSTAKRSGDVARLESRNCTVARVGKGLAEMTVWWPEASLNCASTPARSCWMTAAIEAGLYRSQVDWPANPVWERPSANASTAKRSWFKETPKLDVLPSDAPRLSYAAPLWGRTEEIAGAQLYVGVQMEFCQDRASLSTASSRHPSGATASGGTIRIRPRGPEHKRHPSVPGLVPTPALSSNAGVGGSELSR